MATATLVHLPGPSSFSLHHGGDAGPVISPAQVPRMTPPAEAVDMDEVIHLAGLCRRYLNVLALELPDLDHSRAYTADDIVALPLSKHRVPDVLHDLPRRKSSRHAQAEAIASLLDPSHEGSLTAVIRYETDRVRLRGWAALQRKYDRLVATIRNGRATQGLTVPGAQPGVRASVWSSRILAQGPWDPVKTPVSLDGVSAIPMPVKVAQEMDLAPFLGHLERGGTHELNGDEDDAVLLDNGKGEPYYGVQAAEFRKGVIYEDGRMDLCKMVVGPDHIWRLMDSLQHNVFVRHFLLGNNIIGPSGAEAIATFIGLLPKRMETWYLAGNCIDGPGFKILVDALVKSPAVSNIWLKRNPLGPSAAHDVFRLITETENLRTLDLDQTELGDQGTADLFTELAAYTPPEGKPQVLPLRNLYLNGNGMSAKGAKALASFLASPHCGVTSLYLSSNPLGNEGIQALAAAVSMAPYLTRLFLQSVGVSTQGVVALCDALANHPGLRSLDLGQAYATEDLGQAYNFIDDGALTSLSGMLLATPHLEYLNLSHCPVTMQGLLELSSSAVVKAPSLLYFFAESILPDPAKAARTFTPADDNRFADLRQRTKDEISVSKAVRARLEAQVRARYGEHVDYTQFMAEEKRWLVSDREDVRKIDSVYRNRDAGMARRGLLTLVKDWDEGDTTLDMVKNAEGPVCFLRKRS